MARIYEAWAGEQIIRNPPIGEISFDKVIPLLTRREYARHNEPTRFEIQGLRPNLDEVRAASAIYIHTDDQEPIPNGWSAGWYFLMVVPAVAKKLLGL